MNLVNEGVLPPNELDDRDERREEREVAQKRETLAEIVAEMRRREKSHYYPKVARNIMHQYSDRLEAAWRRDEERAVEHATRHAEAVARDNCRDCVHNPKGKNFEGGNAAAMREALVLCSRIIGENGIRGNVFLDDIQEAQRAITAALSAPARNCDKYATADEAYDAYDEITHADIDKYDECRQNCPMCDEKLYIPCGVKWLFAPAAERKGATA